LAVLQSQRGEILQTALGRIQNRWGAHALENATARTQRLSAADLPDAIPTGIRQLDDLTSVGGLPLGRVSLLLGEMGSGRMVVAYHLLASASRSTAATLLLDMHGHADPWLLARLQADLGRVLVMRDVSLRDALEAAIALVRAGVGCVVADLPARAGTSRLWDPYAAALARACAKESAALLISAEKIAEPLAYASSLTLRLQRREWIWRQGDVIGARVRATVEKSKLGSLQRATTRSALHYRGSTPHLPDASVELSLGYPLGTFVPPQIADVEANAKEAIQEPLLKEPLLKVLAS